MHCTMLLYNPRVSVTVSLQRPPRIMGGERLRANYKKKKKKMGVVKKEGSPLILFKWNQGSIKIVSDRNNTRISHCGIQFLFTKKKLQSIF